MAGIGWNPRYGWDPNQNSPQGDAFSFVCGIPPAYDGYLPPPPPPPGYAWFDFGAAAPIQTPAMSWGIAGSAPLPAHWNPHGPDWFPGLAGAAQDGAFPGANFHNVHGGMGMEPGYAYIFPPSHCKIHVIDSPSPPWLHAGPYGKRCFNVPTSITVKELMQQFGCTNADAKQNRLVELTQGSDGTWYKGVELEGSDEKKMGKRIDEIGWNMKRNGVEADFVWLWFAKV